MSTGAGPLDMYAPGLLAGRVALVTGGGRGIGRTIALGLAGLGADLVLAGRTADTLEATAKEIDGVGARALAQPTDIRQPDQVDALRDAALGAFGHVDFLINNAGGQFPAKPSTISDRGWRAVVDLNLNGTWNVISRFLDPMAGRGGGAIVNIVHNFVGERGASLFPHSGAARAGVVALTRSLAPYLAAKDVTINAIAPGFIDSAGYRMETDATALSSSGEQSMMKQMGLGRLGTPDEVAALVAFLCSPGGRYVNGALLVADGAVTQMNLPLLDLLDFNQL